ncbi:MAG: hypothetical protein ACRD1C_08235 [Terriglobales bacterium]
MLTPALIAAGCGRAAFRSPEVLLFSTIGYRIFQDYIWVADPAGDEVRAFLRPAGQRSYLEASACSLAGPVAIIVHKTMPSGIVDDEIDLYRPTNRWRRLWYQPPASPGDLAISPVGALVAATMRPTPGDLSHIWIIPTSGGEPMDISGRLPAGTGDYSPQWSQSGERLMFRRISVSDAGRHYVTELLSFSPATGQVSVFLPQRPEFLMACFGPRESLILREGLVLNLLAADGTSTRLLDAHAIPGAALSDAGMIYSERLNLIAFTMVRGINTPQESSEIWLLDLAGSKLRRLYATTSGRVAGISFARR